MDEIRLAHDILLVGHHTMEVDDPVIWARDSAGNVELDTPIPVVLCGKTLPSKNLRIVNDPPFPVLILADKTRHSFPVESPYTDLDDGVEAVWQFIAESSGPYYLGANPSQLSPEGILKILSHLPGEGRVLLEGGPTLNGQFLEADLIDNIYLTVVPFVMGGDSPGFSGQSQSITDFHVRDWSLENVDTSGNELYLTYMRSR
jgi:riboflavin biosynthesis pyrimidine reductase